MTKCIPVKVYKQSFFGCRWTMTALVLIALVFHTKEILFLSLIVFVLSAILGIERAPFIVFYNFVLSKTKMKLKYEVLDKNAMRFAHSFGATLNGLALIFLYFINPTTGWILTIILALAKISGSFGFCGAQKLYGCLNSQTCCAFIKGKKNGQC